MFAAFLLFLVVPTLSSLVPDHDLPAAALADIKWSIAHVHQDLVPFTIEVHSWDKSDQYFARSGVTPTSAILPASKRTYEVFINPMLYNKTAGFHGPRLDALKSILTHELCHVANYTHMSSVQLAAFAAKYATNHHFLIEVEHATDECVLQADMALGWTLRLFEGLANYRTWIYGVLAGDPDNLAKKKEEYMTPDEIYEWVRTHGGPVTAAGRRGDN
jgi:hypothetical protein